MNLGRAPVLVFFVAAGTLLLAAAAFAATRHCNGGTCMGTDGADRILGSNLDETVFANMGPDKLFGRDGADQLKGEEGRDEVHGQGGDDRVKGGTGRDAVFGEAGDDLVRAGTHDRTNDGVRDVLDCGDGVDTVYYIPGQDVIRDCEIENPSE